MHDSFLVPESKAILLWEVMRESYGIEIAERTEGNRHGTCPRIKASGYGANLVNRHVQDLRQKILENHCIREMVND